MKKEFVTYEIALALKELGFDEGCFSLYFNNGEFSNFIHSFTVNSEVVEKTSSIPAPTFSQAFRFFREKYNLCVWITSKTVDSKTVYIIHGRTIPDTIKNNLIVDIIPYITLKTYQQAELECLKKLIKIVKEKK